MMFVDCFYFEKVKNKSNNKYLTKNRVFDIIKRKSNIFIIWKNRTSQDNLPLPTIYDKFYENIFSLIQLSIPKRILKNIRGHETWGTLHVLV